mmetsp:Transcript_63279/g.145522  ORF Transcript_63279/g.145522 Transcript_63279/m.145522 type:complete len:262 (-) Transcript_63279:1445-2230(-)
MQHSRNRSNWGAALRSPTLRATARSWQLRTNVWSCSSCNTPPSNSNSSTAVTANSTTCCQRPPKTSEESCTASCCRGARSSDVKTEGCCSICFMPSRALIPKVSVTLSYIRSFSCCSSSVERTKSSLCDNSGIAPSLDWIWAAASMQAAATSASVSGSFIAFHRPLSPSSSTSMIRLTTMTTNSRRASSWVSKMATRSPHFSSKSPTTATSWWAFHFSCNALRIFPSMKVASSFAQVSLTPSPSTSSSKLSLSKSSSPGGA